MSDRVNNLKEAKEWFLRTHYGQPGAEGVTCHRSIGNSTLERFVDNYPDAKSFYAEEAWCVVEDMLELCPDANQRAIILQGAIADLGPVPDELDNRFRSLLRDGGGCDEVAMNK